MAAHVAVTSMMLITDSSDFCNNNTLHKACRNFFHSLDMKTGQLFRHLEDDKRRISCLEVPCHWKHFITLLTAGSCSQCHSLSKQNGIIIHYIITITWHQRQFHPTSWITNRNQLESTLQSLKIQQFSRVRVNGILFFVNRQEMLPSQ